MATPAPFLNPLTGNRLVDGLLNGSSWQLDASRTITWGIADNERYAWADEAFAVRVIGSALATIEAVANIRFAYVGRFTTPYNASADITYNLGDSALLGSGVEGFSAPPNTALTNLYLAGYNLNRAQYPSADGDVWYNNDFSALAIAANGPGSETRSLILHETGHALGLKHPHDDGRTGRPTFSSLGLTAGDVETYTVMSYNPASGFSNSTGNAATPGYFDIAALQALYGANPNTGGGDSLYRFVDDGAIRTIYDVNGNDTLDASAIGSGMIISLRPGDQTASRVRSPTSIIIAANTLIESAVGGAGNDLIGGNAANNTIAGGGGTDTYVLSGARSTYQLARPGGAVATIDTIANRDGTDTLVDIERVRFTDQTLAFDTDGNAGQTYRLYRAAFARTPDTAGLTQNVNVRDGGASLHDLAAAFIISGEFTGRYGTNSTDQAFITALYRNVLNREPDAEGYSYWSGRLATRQADRADVLTGFSESAENKNAVAATIAGGITLGNLSI